jgi:cyclic-di-AMP phosphodiesterase PgpH
MFKNKINKDFFKKLLENPKFQVFLFFIINALLISFIINVRVTNIYHEYKLGDIAKRTIRAHQAVEIEDNVTTRWARDEAGNNAPPIYDYDANMVSNIKSKVHDAFKALRSKKNQDANNKEEFEKHLGIKINDFIFKVFQKEKFSWRVERAVLYALGNVPTDRYIVEGKDKNTIFNTRTGSIIVNKINEKNSKEEQTNNETNSQKINLSTIYRNFVTIEEIKSSIEKFLSKIFNKFSMEERKAIRSFLHLIISPNLTFNKASTVQAKNNARERVNKVITRINRGDVIVQRGETINKSHINVISELKDINKFRRGWIPFIINFIVFLFIILGISFYAKSFINYLLPKKRKDFLTISTVTIFYIFFAKVWFFVSNLLSNYFSIPMESFFFIFPFVALAFILRVVFSAEIAALTCIISSAVISFIIGIENYQIFIYVLFSCFASTVFLTKFQKRSDLFIAGLKIGLFQMGFATFLMISKIDFASFNWMFLIYFALASLLSGILSAFVAEGVIPIIESIFNYTTNIKLLEFVDTNHPLLKELLIKAPGTYQHSMLVGQLASAGAESIGANSTLARVASYYHDVGKIEKSMYFYENQQGVANPHDKLNPTMSAKILASHVKDSYKLCQKYRLGEYISSIASQHHGTSIMKFFYNKAKEQDENTNDLDYRYPGPKPKTREAVLVMIADACEAASRSLDEPSVNKIKNTVDSIINNMFVDGQFDESNITLKRLKIISDVYAKTLVTLYHSRIEYPETKEVKVNGTNTEKRKRDKDTPKVIKENNKKSFIEGEF